MKKRIVSIKGVAVLLALNFVLTGCGKKEDSQEEIEDPVINSMSVEDICRYLTDTVNLRSHQSYFCNAGNSDDLDWYEDDGVIDRGRIVVYDSEDPDNYDSPLTYYINFTVSEFDPDVVSELNVGDYSAGGTIVAISGNFTLIAFEVTDYELYQMYEEDINSVSIYDCTNHSAPYSSPELQAVYELFVELGEASSLDDIDVESIVSEIPEETTQDETVPLATTDESLVINSMSVEEICEFLSNAVYNGSHQYHTYMADDLADAFVSQGVVDLGRYCVFDNEDLTSTEIPYTYYVVYSVTEFDPATISTLSVGDDLYFLDGPIVAISGNFVLCAYEVTDLELFSVLMHAPDPNIPYSDYENSIAPYSDPELQAVLELFVELGEATSLDDLEIEAYIPETTEETSTVEGSTAVPENADLDPNVCWYDEGYVTSPHTYTNTTYIRLDYINEYYLSYQSGTIFYDVVYNGQTVYTSTTGHSEGLFDTSYPGAPTNGQYMAAGTYTISFYDADISDSQIATSTCTVE